MAMTTKELATAFGIDMSSYQSGGRLDMPVRVILGNDYRDICPIIESDHGSIENGVEYHWRDPKGATEAERRTGFVAVKIDAGDDLRDAWKYIRDNAGYEYGFDVDRMRAAAALIDAALGYAGKPLFT